MDDEAYRLLQLEWMDHPTAGAAIEGRGGLRKLRGIQRSHRQNAVAVCQGLIKRLRKPMDLAGSKVMHCRNHLDRVAVAMEEHLQTAATGLHTMPHELQRGAPSTSTDVSASGD